MEWFQTKIVNGYGKIVCKVGKEIQNLAASRNLSEEDLVTKRNLNPRETARLQQHKLTRSHNLTTSPQNRSQNVVVTKKELSPHSPLFLLT